MQIFFIDFYSKKKQFFNQKCKIFNQKYDIFMFNIYSYEFFNMLKM